MRLTLAVSLGHDAVLHAVLQLSNLLHVVFVEPVLVQGPAAVRSKWQLTPGSSTLETTRHEFKNSDYDRDVSKSFKFLIIIKPIKSILNHFDCQASVIAYLQSIPQVLSSHVGHLGLHLVRLQLTVELKVVGLVASYYVWLGAISDAIDLPFSRSRHPSSFMICQTCNCYPFLIN